MREKYVIIGAGSAVFTRGLVSDLIRTGQPADLALVDIDPHALEVAQRLVQKMIAQTGAKLTLSASLERRDVLSGATVVITTIGVGGRRAWEQDVFIPRKYGLYYPVGDTVGPGGTSRAMRMIPPMVAIARDVLELCPDALFFNYGNPMAPVCRAVRKATGANVVGLCHGVNHIAHYLAEVLDAQPADLTYTAVGYNHLTWFTHVRVCGQDAMPRLRLIADQRIAAAQRVDGQPVDEPHHDPFSWRLFRLFGAFPAVLDRHVTEFFPQFFREGRHYGHVLGMDSYSFEGTIAEGDADFAEMETRGVSAEALPVDWLGHEGGEHEQVIDIVNSIRKDAGDVYSANLPNTGQAPGFPLDGIVEGPAIADAQGLRAVAQPPLPPALTGALATRFQWVETVVEAALEGSRDKFVQALVLDGGAPSLEIAEQLAHDLLAAQAEYLPGIKG